MPTRFYTREEVISAPLPKNRKDLTGKIFGKSTALAYFGLSSYKRTLWYSECQCGAITIRTDASLWRKSSSCLSCKGITHGKSIGVAEYASWQNMKDRCFNPKNKRAIHYYGRGITVCDRWVNSFQNFLGDMGRKPTPKHTIDRINNDGNYEPSNCRWATKKEQNNNCSRNVSVTIGDETRNLSEWCESGSGDAHYMRSLYRIRHGWCPRCALNVSPNGGTCPHKVGAK